MVEKQGRVEDFAEHTMQRVPFKIASTMLDSSLNTVSPLQSGFVALCESSLGQCRLCVDTKNVFEHFVVTEYSPGCFFWTKRKSYMHFLISCYRDQSCLTLGEGI